MSSGRGDTRTLVNQATPQILPQGQSGYNLASGFNQGILANPQVYGGQTVAPLDPLQQAAAGQAQQVFGQGPTGVSQGAADTIGQFEFGNFLFGPGAQAAVSSLAQPIFQQF